MEEEIEKVSGIGTVTEAAEKAVEAFGEKTLEDDALTTFPCSKSSPAINSFREIPNISHSSIYTETSGRQMPLFLS